MSATFARRRALGALLTVSLLSAACGSTVPVGQGQQAGVAPGTAAPVADDGLGLDVASGTEAAGAAGSQPGQPGTTGAPGAARAGGAGAPAGSPAGGSSSAGQASGQGSQASTAAGGSAPGVTDDTIHLGFYVTENGGAANEAIGAAGVSQGDPREYVRVVVDDLNERGGIAGRTVKPVVFAYDAQSAASDEQQHQEACSYWTEDNAVFAAAAPAAARDNLRSCMGQRGVPLLGTGLTREDANGMASFPLYAEPNTMNLTRIVTNLVPGLDAQDYFEPESAAEPMKLGVVRYDYPTFQRATDEALKPALQRHGIEVTQEHAVRVPANSNDLGGVASDINAAILRFRQEGVNHVILVELNATLAFLFMRSAENQGYRPQYGMHTQNGAQALAELVPPEQLHNAVGIGWLPQIDVRDVDVPRSAARDRCLKLMRSEGIQFPDKNAKGVALIYCDQAQFFKAAAEAGDALTGQGFINGVESLGSRFAPALTIGTRFSRNQHDGASVYRHVRFVDGCNCFKYSSGAKRAS